MNEKTVKIKYLENGMFKEMEVKPIVKQILDEYYHGYPYMYHSKLIIMDEIGLIETTLKVMKRKVNQLLQEIDKLKRVRNPYSEKIFPEPTKKQWKKRNEALEKTGLSIDQFSGSLCRLGWNNALDDVRSLIKRTFSGVVE